jgi:hypothetical protein
VFACHFASDYRSIFSSHCSAFLTFSLCFLFRLLIWFFLSFLPIHFDFYFVCLLFVSLSLLPIHFAFYIVCLFVCFFLSSLFPLFYFVCFFSGKLSRAAKLVFLLLKSGLPHFEHHVHVLSFINNDSPLTIISLIRWRKTKITNKQKKMNRYSKDKDNEQKKKNRCS